MPRTDPPALTAPRTGPGEEELARQEEALARTTVERALRSNMGPLGIRYAVEDVESRRKFPRLTDDVRAELLAALRKGEVAA